MINLSDKKKKRKKGTYGHMNTEQQMKPFEGDFRKYNRCNIKCINEEVMRTTINILYVAIHLKMKAIILII